MSIASLVLMLAFCAAPRLVHAHAQVTPADAYEGFDPELLAECLARHNEFKTRFGDTQGPLEFDKYLKTRSLDAQRFWRAYQVWYERFNADKSGKLLADFLAREALWSTKLNFGDVPDASQTAKEGVTLDTYATIVASMMKPGANAEDIVRTNGLKDMQQWERVNKAWADAMGQDTSFRLTTQYAELYQKYAGAASQAAEQQTVAGILAEANNPRAANTGGADAMADLSPEALFTRLGSANRDERWEAARWLGLKCDADMVDKKNAAMLQRCAAAVPVLIDILEHHDDETVQRAEDAAAQLADMVGGRTPDARLAMQHCLARAQEKLKTLQPAFAAIKDKAVPERMTLITKIQEYESLVKALDQQLKAWR
jgi:hypothetical protein